MRGSLLEERWREEFEMLIHGRNEMSSVVKVKSVMKHVAVGDRKSASRTPVGLVMMGMVIPWVVVD